MDLHETYDDNVWNHPYGAWLRALGVAAILAAVAFATFCLVRVEGEVSMLFDLVVYNSISVMACLSCFARARIGRTDRRAWLLLGIGASFPVLGEMVAQFYYGGYENMPFPSLAEIFFNGYYPLTIAGLMLLLRTQVQRSIGTVLLDAMISGLGVAALVGWLLFPIIADALEGSLLLQLVVVSVPTSDVILVVLAAIAVSLLGRSAGIHWWLIITALLLQAFADSVYYVQLSNDTYVEGTMLDALWPFANVALTMAALLSPVRHRQPGDRSWFELSIPTLVGIAALLLLAADRVTHVPAVSFLLALGTVVLIALRTLWSFLELQSLAATRKLANTDDLTGIANRRGLDKELHRLTVGDDRHPFTLLIIDLDRFKEINDSLGHAAGDQVLRLTAERLQAQLGADAFVARVAGDEFAAILTGPKEHAAAKAVLLRSALTDAYQVGSVRLQTDASIGIARWPVDADDVDGLLAAADHAMYRVKSAGGGVCLFDPKIDRPDRDRVELINELRECLRTGQQITPFFQPIVDLRTGRAVSAEALVRWQHPTRGELQPSTIIPLASRAVLLTELTLLMLEQACRNVIAWQRRGHFLNVSVNVHAATLVDLSFPEQVTAIVDAAGIARHLVTLEVTEEGAISDPKRSLIVLNELRRLGFTLVVDDYGTGMAALSYLKDLPVQGLKLDRSFIVQLDQPRTRAIVTSTVALADNLEMQLVAEGVEDVETAEVLRTLGARFAQGYLFSRPVPGDRFLGWLEANVAFSQPPMVPSPAPLSEHAMAPTRDDGDRSATSAHEHVLQGVVVLDAMAGTHHHSL
jgi:diguanylate cyclase